MKKTTLLISLWIVLLSNIDLAAQSPYKPFSMFANDTTAFLRYNFNERADQYKGKKVSDVLRDLQISPKAFATASTMYLGKYSGLCIFLDGNRWKLPAVKPQYIYIYWEGLQNLEPVIKLYRQYDNDKWVQQHYDFFKDMTVGKVSYSR
ncbi:MAG: hypothetical protein QM654_10065 [Dysgonamonadaceae bacterium]